ncbi:hypothetical protein KKF34_17220 [Myxococcota bacterium]|nr:hypothetical protein [Myxococcota bacterium]MBU1382336.1 hypothetical protein [Myxococcota bacterium]MBU1498622.1 hypothetical protein [Myxococcota bacterium]
MTIVRKTTFTEEQILLDFLEHALNPPFLPCGFEKLPVWSEKRGKLLLRLGKLKEESPAVFSQIIEIHQDSITQTEIIANGLSEIASKLMDRLESTLGMVRSSRKHLKTYLADTPETSGGFSWKI